MRKTLLLPLVCCAACAANAPLVRRDTTPEQAETDRLQCEAQMYSERQAKGRGAPNWNLYEYCMRQRGYAKVH